MILLHNGPNVISKTYRLKNESNYKPIECKIDCKCEMPELFN